MFRVHLEGIQTTEWDPVSEVLGGDSAPTSSPTPPPPTPSGLSKLTKGASSMQVSDASCFPCDDDGVDTLQEMATEYSEGLIQDLSGSSMVMTLGQILTDPDPGSALMTQLSGSSGGLKSTKDLLQEAPQKIADAVADAPNTWRKFTDFVSSMGTGIKDFFVSTGETISDGADWLFGWAKETAEDGIDDMEAMGQKIGNAITEKVIALGGGDAAENVSPVSLTSKKYTMFTVGKTASACILPDSQLVDLEFSKSASSDEPWKHVISVVSLSL